ncbi:predicted transcriptional regulator [Lactiplantibacillus plantarum]|nr:predicted transcriptional regulator [Lactiplantibacillus plantarum]
MPYPNKSNSSHRKSEILAVAICLRVELEMIGPLYTVIKTCDIRPQIDQPVRSLDYLHISGHVT